jgi:hypothetical protein
MGVVKLSTAGIRNYSKTSDFLSGNLPLSLGAFDLLETTTLTTSAANIIFDNINTYAADYKHLQVRYSARTTRVNSGDHIKLRFNSSTASDYAFHKLEGNGSSVTSTVGSSNFGNIEIYDIDGNGAPTGAMAAGIIDILDPFSSTKNTTIRTLNANHYMVALQSASWRNTAVLSKLDFSCIASYNTATRFSLYGVK